jgi:hypothetical protein
VYRALLRERPGDLRLDALLAEAEEAARFGPPAAPEPVSTPSVEVVAPEPVLAPEPAGVEPWPGAEPEAAFPAWEAAPETIVDAMAPDAWGGEAEAAGAAQPFAAAGEPIGAYLRRLAAWRPGAAVEAPVEPAPAAEPSPAAIPPVAASAVPPAAPAADPSAIEDAFNAMFGGAEPTAAPEAVPAGGEVGRAAPAAAGSEVAGEVEDDDLEMFRTWLQNLKR